MSFTHGVRVTEILVDAFPEILKVPDGSEVTLLSGAAQAGRGPQAEGGLEPRRLATAAAAASLCTGLSNDQARGRRWNRGQAAEWTRGRAPAVATPVAHAGEADVVVVDQ